MPHKTTVAYAQKHAVKCTTCGYETSMTDAEMNDENTTCNNCSKMDKEAVQLKLQPTDQVKVMTSSSDLEKARIKAAFSCSSKLALAGIIEASEVDAYADQMLNDNLKADAMIRQTKLLLKSAQASSERVAAAAAERMSNTRTASTLGISTTPAFSGSNVNNAALDIQSALKGTWSMPQIED
jgi:translation initiation factor IF-1